MEKREDEEKGKGRERRERGKGRERRERGKGRGRKKRIRVFIGDNLYTYISVLVWFVDCHVMCRG